MQRIIDTDTFFSQKLIIKIRVWTGKQRIETSFNLGFLQQNVMTIDASTEEMFFQAPLNMYFSIFSFQK